MSESADGASESASKKSANHLAEECLSHESTMPDAEEEASVRSDVVESPKKKRKVVS